MLRDERYLSAKSLDNVFSRDVRKGSACHLQIASLGRWQSPLLSHECGKAFCKFFTVEIDHSPGANGNF
jgi:hypothetical protein